MKKDQKMHEKLKKICEEASTYKNSRRDRNEALKSFTELVDKYPNSLAE